MMRFALVALAMLMLVAFAANPSIAQVTGLVQYDEGRVVALWVSSGVYEVQVLTTGENLTLTVPEELWRQLDIGDTMIQDADGWHLLRKGPQSPDDDED